MRVAVVAARARGGRRARAGSRRSIGSSKAGLRSCRVTSTKFLTFDLRDHARGALRILARGTSDRKSASLMGTIGYAGSKAIERRELELFQKFAAIRS